jgi:hypothetical protein
VPELGVLRAVLHVTAYQDAGPRQQNERRGEPDGETAPERQAGDA